MISASTIPVSSTLRVSCQNVNVFQMKVTLRKRNQTRIVALGSLLRSLEVDFFAIQEPHLVTVEDRRAGTRCLSKYGYSLDGPLHVEGRGGVALAWKTFKWTLPCVRATGYCRAMAQCALQNYSAHYGSGSWVCNPMS